MAVGLSGDGQTLALVDETFALTVRGRNADGTWAAPQLIRQFPKAWDTPYLSLDHAGRALM